MADMEMKIHSQNNCFLVSPEEMRAMEQAAVSFTLPPGTKTLSIQSGNFSHEYGQSGEPLVMLWIYGGQVTNHQTQVPVASTWSSLNGYSDRLVLDIQEATMVSAFFLDDSVGENHGEITLSVESV
jgi:hypothetical protein